MTQAFDPPRPWQQYYPTYAYSERDVLLAEFQNSSAATAAEEKLFTSSSNIALIVAAGVSSLAVGSLNELYTSTQNIVAPKWTVLVLIGLLLLFSSLTLKHFAERQKAIQLAKRKIVVLRTMLGLDYGPVQLVLPSWRLEGATQPFAIRLFSGWSSYPAYPFWVIGVFSAVVLFYLTAHYYASFVVDPVLGRVPGLMVASIAASSWLLALAGAYRRSLFDTHETPTLLTATISANAMGLGLVESPEYTLYRAKLAAFELSRLGFDLRNLKNVLLFIEDRGFYSHGGISFRGIARAARDYVTRGRLTGGSTITQQLARSLFVVEYSKTYRRKIVETILAIWMETQFDKEYMLELYLSAVRFDDYVFGTAAASRHFFGAQVIAPTRAQAFFLIERISNIRGRVLVRRVNSLAVSAVQAGLLSRGELVELAGIYLTQVERGLRPDDPKAWDAMLNTWMDLAVQ